MDKLLAIDAIAETSPSRTRRSLRREENCLCGASPLAKSGVVVLNPIGKLVYDSIDGHHTLRQIGQELALRFPGVVQWRIARDVLVFIRELRYHGFIKLR